MKSILLALIVGTAIFTAHAQSHLSATDAEALQKTKDLMLDKEQRNAAIAKDPNAKKADDFVKNVAGESSDDVYVLATRVFEKLVRKYDGDVDKMKAAIERAQRDPAGFAKTEFSPEELQMLKQISEQLPTLPPSK